MKLRVILRDKVIDRQQLKIFVLIIILSRLLINKAITFAKVIRVSNNIVAYIKVLRDYLLLNI